MSDDPMSEAINFVPDIKSGQVNGWHGRRAQGAPPAAYFHRAPPTLPEVPISAPVPLRPRVTLPILIVGLGMIAAFLFIVYGTKP